MQYLLFFLLLNEVEKVIAFFIYYFEKFLLFNNLLGYRCIFGFCIVYLLIKLLAFSLNLSCLLLFMF